MSGAPGTISSLQHRVETLERELRHARESIDKLLDLRRAQVVAPQQVRLVETFTTSPEPYPEAPANTFDIRFLDAALGTWSPGEQTASFSPRSAATQGVGSSINGGYLTESQRALAVLLNEHWWLLSQQSAKLYMRCDEAIPGRHSTTGAMSKGDVTALYKNASHILVEDPSPPANAPPELYNPTFHYWPSNLVVEAWQDARGVWFGKPLWEVFDGINSSIGIPTAKFDSTGTSLSANSTEAVTDLPFTTVSGELADVSSNKIRFKKPGKYRVHTDMGATCSLLSTYASHLAIFVNGSASRSIVQDSRGNTSNVSEFHIIREDIVQAAAADEELDIQVAVSSPTWAGGMFDPRPNWLMGATVKIFPLF